MAEDRHTELEIREIRNRKDAVSKILELAQTEWSSPIFFAPKNERTLRFCLDYRNVKAIPKRDWSVIP